MYFFVIDYHKIPRPPARGVTLSDTRKTLCPKCRLKSQADPLTPLHPIVTLQRPSTTNAEQPMNLQPTLDQYNELGVTTVRALLAPADLAQIRANYQRYAQTIAPTLGQHEVTFEADGKTVRNLWRMEAHDPYFAQLAHQPRFTELAAALVKGQPILAGVETFNKPARVGSGVPPHQDNAYFCQAPPDMFTLWIALDPATLENGAVHYIKASHKQGVLPHKPSGVKGNSFQLAHDPTPSPKDVYVGLLNPGDALLHHCQAIHYSAPNHTDQPRLGLLFVYRAEHTQTDPDMKATYDKARKLAGMA